jgi:threonine dehydrogenase-like Zn-dependent dehydrogenase
VHYGYACVGRVTHVGSPDDGPWIGRRVFAFHPHASRFIAALADLLPIPETISNDQAVFFPNLETAVSLVQDGAPILGERVAIFGQGVVGLLTAMLVARHPGLTVVSVDPLPRRRQLSLRLGAHASLDPLAARFPSQLAAALGGGQADGAADLAYELSGSATALNAAIRAAGFQARIVIGAWYGSRPAELDLGGEFHRRRLRLVSSQVSRIDPALSARWTKARRYDLTWRLLEQIHADEWITHRIPIAHAGRAYQQLDRRPEETLQVVLTYS